MTRLELRVVIAAILAATQAVVRSLSDATEVAPRRSELTPRPSGA